MSGDAVRRIDLGPLSPAAADTHDASGAAELEQQYRASGGDPFELDMRNIFRKLVTSVDVARVIERERG